MKLIPHTHMLSPPPRVADLANFTDLSLTVRYYQLVTHSFRDLATDLRLYYLAHRQAHRPLSRWLEQKGKNYDTRDSHVVPHHGTNRAVLSLTSQIGRDAVFSQSYGRRY